MTNDDNQEGKFIPLNDIPAYIADLKDQLECERMRLAACGVAAMSNTRETVKVNRQVRDEYRSASLDDVCAAVDREMALRERVAELEAQNHALKRQHAEDEEECREANASLCREIEETIDLNRELTAAKQRIAELEPDFRVPAQLLREEREELRTKLAAMQEQRDEARRRVCELSLIKKLVYRKLDGVDGRFIECKTPEEVAQVYGWDCFAQQEGGGA